MTWLAIGALLKRGLGALWAGISKLNPWQFLLIVALLFAGLQTLRLKAEQRHGAKVEAQLLKATSQLEKLSAQSKSQQKEVTKVVDHYVTVTKPVVKREVEKIEAAPLKPGCQTPDLVMSADL